MIETKNQWKNEENNITSSLNGIGLTSLSNSESTVNFYIAIFQNPWIQSTS
ncbi:hypothetical protein NARC_50167 [Candidatus Nitrosocosmicus arcticus]|uniref:Uncharacterized protein n=1 Tax=Candidatus Nitrosocosmicus arcticus TaxID=2035267 RepID=A0A557SWK8_9ARCH|nr:hypothetical protein NARC_50167 [Candidatus Nitrosocosmicus arcticus]